MSDRWEVYLCRVEDRPASVCLNLRYGQNPLDGHGRVVWLILKVLSPRADGLPNGDEFTVLGAIEDAIEEAIDKLSSNAVYVGRCTCNGTRDFYYYADEESPLESVITEALAKFPDYSFEIGERDDQDWSIYKDFLYPDARQIQVMSDDRVLRALAEDGDDGSIPREVTHWAYFGSDKELEQFTKAITATGYRIQERQKNRGGELALGVVFTRNDAVDRSHIYKITLELLDIAVAHGGTYDGWETPVVPNE